MPEQFDYFLDDFDGVLLTDDLLSLGLIAKLLLFPLSSLTVKHNGWPKGLVPPPVVEPRSAKNPQKIKTKLKAFKDTISPWLEN